MDVVNQAVDWINSQNLKNTKIEVLVEQDKTPLLILIVEANKVTNPRNVFIYGHLDKQPPLTDKWSPGLGPYTPVEKNKRLYGRGSADDGYSLFGYICVIKALQRYDLPYHRLVLLWETDEESGSNDMLYYLNEKDDQLGKPTEIICSDSTVIDYRYLCFTTSQRGIINFTIDVKQNMSLNGITFGGVSTDGYQALRKALLDFEDVKTG